MKHLGSIFLLAAFSLHAKHVAKFESLSGTVQYKVKGGKWVTAKLGQELPADTILETGPRGKAVLVFPNGSKLTLNSLTQVCLDAYSMGKFGTRTVMSLRTGRVVAKIAKYKNSNEWNYFLVRTPTAVAGVRGTIKEVAYTPDKGSEIKLLESDAEVVNASGQKSTVPEGGKSKVSEALTLTADKVATREAAATMTSAETSSAHEVAIGYSGGDYNFSSNTRDFTDMQRLFDKAAEDAFRDMQKKPEATAVEDTLTTEKL